MNEGFEELMDEYLSALDTEYIDSFRKLVAQSMENEFKKIYARYAVHQQTTYNDSEIQQIDYDLISGDAIFTSDVSYLADELSIVALYKIFEKKHKELIAFHRKEHNAGKYSYWENVLSVLPSEAKTSRHISAVNELRLLNNSIKHNGLVSVELSQNFPSYGQAGSELAELDKAFERLKPSVVFYLKELHAIYKKIT
jgi:hypothetical protein